MASNNGIDLKTELRELRAATDIIVMVVPYRTSFRARMDEVRLPKVSCVYEISSRGPTFDQILSTLESIVNRYDEPKPEVDLRIGLVFRNNGNVLREFYFNDAGGFANLKGFSGDNRMSGSADLPDRLRALLTNQDVVLIRALRSGCPHV